MLAVRWWLSCVLFRVLCMDNCGHTSPNKRRALLAIPPFTKSVYCPSSPCLYAKYSPSNIRFPLATQTKRKKTERRARGCRFERYNRATGGACVFSRSRCIARAVSRPLLYVAGMTLTCVLSTKKRNSSPRRCERGTGVRSR